MKRIIFTIQVLLVLALLAMFYVAYGQTLSFTCTDPDGDSVYCDIYFGTTSVPPLLVENLAVSHDSTFTYPLPYPLELKTKYYWIVIARDIHGAETTGPLWNFTTAGIPEVVRATIISENFYGGP